MKQLTGRENGRGFFFFGGGGLGASLCYSLFAIFLFAVLSAERVWSVDRWAGVCSRPLHGNRTIKDPILTLNICE